MKLKVDQKNDALYFRLDESEIVDSEEVKPGIILDYDGSGNVVVVEILKVSKHISTNNLKFLLFETA